VCMVRLIGMDTNYREEKKASRCHFFSSCPPADRMHAIRGQSPSPLTGMFFFGLYHHVRQGVRGGNYVCLSA